MDLHFRVLVRDGIKETYPQDLPAKEVACYIAEEKASAYTDLLSGDTMVITADTIVVCEDTILGKPHDINDAVRMLKMLSGKTHQVITGVCISTKEKKKVFSVNTNVTFKRLQDTEIDYYASKYKPFDKAGAYGIQGWIGHVGVEHLDGSYFNVMGLPVQRIYQTLTEEF